MSTEKRRFKVGDRVITPKGTGTVHEVSEHGGIVDVEFDKEFHRNRLVTWMREPFAASSLVLMPDPEPSLEDQLAGYALRAKPENQNAEDRKQRVSVPIEITFLPLTHERLTAELEKFKDELQKAMLALLTETKPGPHSDETSPGFQKLLAQSKAAIDYARSLRPQKVANEDAAVEYIRLCGENGPLTLVLHKDGSRTVFLAGENGLPIGDPWAIIESPRKDAYPGYDPEVIGESWERDTDVETILAGLNREMVRQLKLGYHIGGLVPVIRIPRRVYTMLIDRPVTFPTHPPAGSVWEYINHNNLLRQTGQDYAWGTVG